MTASEIENSINYVISMAKLGDSGINGLYGEISPVCAPYSLENLRMNGGPSDIEFLTDKLKEFGIRITASVSGFNLDFNNMDTIAEPRIKHHEKHIKLTGRIGIEDSFRLLLDMIVRDDFEVHKMPVRTDEAIFAIKNGAEIPDDFMPKYMMDLIEPAQIPDFICVCRELQISKECRNLFLINCSQNGATGSVSYLVPSSQCVPDSDLDRGSILEGLKKSFRNLEQSEDYVPFTVSRNLRTVMYNLKSRNSRKLPRQISTGTAIEQLKSLNILNLSDSEWVLGDHITLEILEQMKSKYDAMIGETAAKWLQSELLL
ncbi:MAG: hypothetical protein ACP5NK_03905 [Thermoplasmata archaeon]